MAERISPYAEHTHLYVGTIPNPASVAERRLSDVTCAEDGFAKIVVERKGEPAVVPHAGRSQERRP